MIKKNLNETKYNYTLLSLYQTDQTVHRIKSLTYKTTVEYSHRNCTTKIDYTANAVKKLVKFTCNTIDMGTKYCQKQPIFFSKVGCWVLIRK